MRVPPELRCLPHGESLSPENGEERVEDAVDMVWSGVRLLSSEPATQTAILAGPR